MKKLALIVNPFASGVTEARLREVEEALAAAGTVETMVTRARSHAAELVAEATGADAIVVFGGDGIYNEALNGADGLLPFGFIPGGGASVLPRALGLPRDARQAAVHLAESIRQERTRRISLGRVNGRRFSLSAGIGFDAEGVRRMDARGRRTDGRRPGNLVFLGVYAKFVFERRARFDAALEVAGAGRAAFVLVANDGTYTYAGRVPLHIAPEARFELGLDFIAPKEVRAHVVPRFVSVIVRGRGHRRDDILYGHDLDRIEVECDRPLPLQADGEDLGDVERAVFEAERDAISVLV